MTYDLPTSLSVGGELYEIRPDFRPMLDICFALNDPSLGDDDVGEAILTVFYPDFENIPPEHFGEAIKKCFWFLNCGDSGTPQKSPRLVDWEQDFPLIAAPVNRIMGREIRAMEYLHWWTFVSAYREIGDCLFAQVVGIRSKKAKGKKLDKSDQEFYRQNRDIIDFKTTYTNAEETLLEKWGGK